MHPVVFFDALRVKILDKAVYLALAVLPDGSLDVLGIWIEETEGAANQGQAHPAAWRQTVAAGAAGRLPMNYTC